jgi:hypothetical protein
MLIAKRETGETGETGGDSRLLRAVGSSAAGSEISE